jgi:hypothetical protein
MCAGSGEPVLFHQEAFLHCELSEQLLSALCDRGKLDDTALSLFDANVTRLKRVSLRNVGTHISTRGLRVLKGHKVLIVAQLKQHLNNGDGNIAASILACHIILFVRDNFIV